MRLAWRGFLRAQRTPAARVLLTMGGQNSQIMEDRLRQRFRSGRIDKESFELRLSELRRLRQDFNRTRPMVGDLHDPTEREDMGNGGYRRKPLCSSDA